MFSLFKKKPEDEAAQALFARIAAQSRTPEFYSEVGVADTVEGRFEVLTLNMYLVLSRLKSEEADKKAFAQKVFDAFFRNMDDSLRELGVGDMSIGRKIRAMAEAFYGRVGAYESVFEDDDAFSSALSRNVFEVETHPRAGMLVDYAQRVAAALADQTDAALIRGEILFPTVVTEQS